MATKQSKTSGKLTFENPLAQIAQTGTIGGWDLSEDAEPSILKEESSTPSDTEPQVLYVDISRIVSNRYQPREEMDEQALTELMFSIENNGFQGALEVRIHPEKPNKYELSAGHRRIEALRRLNYDKVPVFVRPFNEKQMAYIAWSENSVRVDLNPVEEGRLFLLASKTFNLTQEQIADQLGKERSYVKVRMQAANDPEDIQKLLHQKPNSLRAVVYLRQLKDANDREPIIEQFLAGKLTTDNVREAVERVKQEKENSHKNTKTERASDTSFENTSIEMSMQSEQQAAIAFSNPQQGYTPPTATVPQDRLSDEQKQLALDISKLKTALRALTAYRDGVAQREKVSEEEHKIWRAVQTVNKEINDLHSTR